MTFPSTPDENKCQLNHCHDCAQCGYERTMTKGEREIAEELDEFFTSTPDVWISY